MQFFALLRRNTERFTDADFAPILPDESAQRRVLYAKGVVRQVWNRGDLPGTGFMLEVASADEAQQQIDTLPLIKAGMMEVTALVPLAPYPGFGPQH
jgi:muconolactone delta-isomerase